ncbi:MAG: hypothetical protein G8D91_09210 [gamma proteobacterium symbiont of Clathrolucina costata]
MGAFFIVRADGSQKLISTEKLSDVPESVYESSRRSLEGTDMEWYFARQIQLSIWHYVNDIDNGIDVDENTKGLKTDCQYVLDHYDDVYGIRFLSEPDGTGTENMKMEFLNEEQVCRLMKEAA